MTLLTSQQQHNCATPRRGNLVHKLTANFRDPEHLSEAYEIACEIQQAAKLADLNKNVPPITQEYFNEVKAIVIPTTWEELKLATATPVNPDAL